MRVLLFASCCATLFRAGLCLFPTGAPPAACTSMTPSHGVDPLPHPSPYWYEITEVTANSKFNFTIIGDAENPIEGFMVQARDRSSGAALGTFDAVEGEVRVIDCFGTDTQNCATHESYKTGVESVTVTWNAPSGNPLTNINFVHTVVKEGNEFWVNLIAPLVIDEQP